MERTEEIKTLHKTAFIAVTSVFSVDFNNDRH